MFTYTNGKGIEYHLNTRTVKLARSKKVVKIYYFSKDHRDTTCDMPDGYRVVENTQTGLPFLKKG